MSEEKQRNYHRLLRVNDNGNSKRSLKTQDTWAFARDEFTGGCGLIKASSDFVQWICGCEMFPVRPPFRFIEFEWKHLIQFWWRWTSTPELENLWPGRIWLWQKSFHSNFSFFFPHTNTHSALRCHWVSSVCHTETLSQLFPSIRFMGWRS